MLRRAGKTAVTDRTLFETREDRDATLEAGMESGATGSMERLAEYLKGQS